MEVARGAVFTQLAHGALVLGLVFLVLEVYQLRVAVENAGVGNYDDGSRTEQLAQSLQEPLGAIARRLGEVSAALDRPVVVRDGGALTSAADNDTSSVQKQRVVPASTSPRQQISTELHPQLAAMVTAIKNIEKRPRVTRASVPHQSAETRPMQPRAVLGTVALLRKSRSARSQFLLMTTKEVLAHYGKPVHIGLGEMGQVSWYYEMANSFWLHFRFYDGRVIDVSL